MSSNNGTDWPSFGDIIRGTYLGAWAVIATVVIVVTYTYPVEIRNGQVVQTGASSAASAITLGGKP